MDTGKRAPEKKKKKKKKGEHLVKPFEDTGSNAGRLLLEPAGQIERQPLGLVRVVELPGLSERLAHGGVQRLGQALDEIAGLVNMVALD